MSRAGNRYLMFLTLLATPTAALADERVNVIVSDLRDEGVGPQAARLLSEVLALELSRFPQLDVRSYAEIRDELTHEALLQLLGCDTEECMRDLSRELQGRYLVRGAVGWVSNRTLVTASLLDIESGKSLDEASQWLVGGDADLLSAVRAVGLDVVSSLVGLKGQAGRLRVEQIERLLTAERDKLWNVDLLGGPALPLKVAHGAAIEGLGWHLSCGPELNLLPYLLVGVHLRYALFVADYEDSMAIIDIPRAVGFKRDVRSNASLQAVGGTLQVRLRKPYGLVLPFVVVAAGATHLTMELGDAIVQEQGLPAGLNIERRGDQGWGAVAEAGGGVTYLLTDWLALTLDARVQTVVHELQERSRPALANVEYQTTSLDPITTFVVSLGLGLQR